MLCVLVCGCVFFFFCFQAEAGIRVLTVTGVHTCALPIFRESTGGIPIGFKLSAQRIEEDIDAALDIGADYIILDGRGGGTGTAPLLFRNHISVPTIPALARERQHLDAWERSVERRAGVECKFQWLPCY